MKLNYFYCSALTVGLLLGLPMQGAQKQRFKSLAIGATVVLATGAAAVWKAKSKSFSKHGSVQPSAPVTYPFHPCSIRR